MKKNKKHKSHSRTSCLTAGLCFVLLFSLVPLFVENRYFNIVEAKAHMLTVICLLADLCAVAVFIRDRKKHTLNNVNAFDAGVLTFSAAAVISCLLSKQSAEAFWGMQGWGIGGFLLASLGIGYFFLSRHLKLSRKIIIPIYIVTVFVLILSVFHSAGIDLLNLHTDIYQPQYHLYKSTLGNTNAHVGYVCLLLPVTWLQFADAKKNQEAIFWLVPAVLLLADIALCCCDGFYLGMGVCVMFALPYICADAQRLRRSLLLLGVFSLWLCIAHMSLFAECVKVAEGISEKILLWPITIGLFIVGAGGYAAARRFPVIVENESLRSRYKTVAYILLALTVVFFFVHTICTFSDNWGTHRGMIWRVSLEYYATLGWKEKIFGIGPELLPSVYAQLMDRKIPVFVAHSEPIQILLTMGFLGFTAWVFLWYTVLSDFLRNRLRDRRKIIFALPLLAYAGQSLLYSATATNIGMLCGIAACYRMTCVNAATGNIGDNKKCQSNNKYFKTVFVISDIKA